MAERTTVEVLISAFTEAAEEAIGDVGDSLNGMTADAAGWNGCCGSTLPSTTGAKPLTV